MDLPRACAIGGAWSSALLDGVLVGGWLATRELDDRPSARRRARALLCTAFGVQAFAPELAWQLLVGPDHPAAATDRRALGQGLAVASVATAVLTPVHRRLPVVLSRAGVRRPDLVLGLAVGTVYAACTLPVWLAQARRRLATWDTHLPPARPPVDPAASFARPDVGHRRRRRLRRSPP